jgi:hypothetical protein
MQGTLSAYVSSMSRGWPNSDAWRSLRFSPLLCWSAGPDEVDENQESSLVPKRRFVNG